MKKQVKRRQFRFKNWAVTLKVWKVGNRFVFNEAHLGRTRALLEATKYTTYETCIKAMQRYSKRYYGEKAV